MVFRDVIGPFRLESLIGFCFFIGFAVQYTKFVFMDLLKTKTESLASLKEFLLSVGTPKKPRQDNAKKFSQSISKCTAYMRAFHRRRL